VKLVERQLFPLGNSHSIPLPSIFGGKNTLNLKSLTVSDMWAEMTKYFVWVEARNMVYSLKKIE
jgi:hypothetical protein